MKRNRTKAALALGMFLALHTGAVHAQGAPSDGDKKFLKELTEDSTFAIETAKLALQKSPSQDVKAYATMLVHDHTALLRQIHTIDTTAKIKPESAGSMTVADHAKYGELKLLSGETFDKSYLKGLARGNDEIQKDEQAVAANSSVASIKRLAQHSAELDTKHSDKAKQLAKTHTIQ